MTARIFLIAFTLLLGGCDLEALLADPKVAQKEADAKAIGGACRFGMRSIEDCYALNEKASKSAVFSGWKDMDQYMRDNKVEGVPAKIAKVTPPLEEIIDESKPDKAVEDAPKTKGKAKAADKTH
jgi:hypothetical protein